MRRIVDFLKSEGAPWLLAAAASLCLSFLAVWFGGLNQDEGWYLYAAQMVRAGRFPFHDFFYTQGPAMPFVYSALAPVWGPSSPLHGLLGGRVVTLALGFLSTFCAMGLVRRLVPPGRRGTAGLAVFAVLACNVYHLYFTTIPKTYALGGLFVLAGLLLVAGALVPADGGAFRGGVRPALLLAAGGLSLAFATGTRISLLLILPVVGFTLLLRFRDFRWSFLWFGLGGALGLFLTYGLFALDPVSLRALLAAQGYHAARGGFDPFFAVGSVSRLARGYAALGAVLFAAAFLRLRAGGAAPARTAGQSAVCWMLGLGFAAVFLLQLSAPFPYDDYQVPVMGLLAVLIVAWFARAGEGPGAAWYAVFAACMVSFASPQLQEWATYGQDRFWSRRKEMTELAKLRAVGRAVEALDPGGKTLFTQDLYLAVETGRTVPAGMEMGPFCYFPHWGDAEARAVHVLNRNAMTELVRSAPAPVAACSGYAFAISVPKCDEVPADEQRRYADELARNYDLVRTVPDFGQNATPLRIYLRKSPKPQEAK